jgi:hypothetical protein
MVWDNPPIDWRSLPYPPNDEFLKVAKRRTVKPAGLDLTPTQSILFADHLGFFIRRPGMSLPSRLASLFDSIPAICNGAILGGHHRLAAAIITHRTQDVWWYDQSNVSESGSGVDQR